MVATLRTFFAAASAEQKTKAKTMKRNEQDRGGLRDDDDFGDL